MTIERIRDQARRYARIHNTWASGDGVVTDAHVNELIQDGIRRFATDVNGLEMEEYLAISALFTTRTTMGIHVTILDSEGSSLIDADIAITSTNRDEVSGTIVASDLQAAIRTASGALGTETVTWTPFYFVINFGQGSSITIEAPDSDILSDSRERIGLEGYSVLGDTVTGSFPEDCTVRISLPSDMITMQRVEWNGWPLTEIPQQYAQSPESFGTPWAYHVRGRELYLIPSPDHQDELHVWYRGQPIDIVFAGYQECGLSGKSAKTSTGLSTSTTYYFKVSIDNGPVTEYSILTGSDISFSAVITLMNAELSGAIFSLVSGDLRCTSQSITGVSEIALSAGTTGTDLFDTLTGFTAFETTASGDINLPSVIPESYHDAIYHWVASRLADEAFDTERMSYHEVRYQRIKNQFIVNRENASTEIDNNRGDIWRIPRVKMPS